MAGRADILAGRATVVLGVLDQFSKPLARASAALAGFGLAARDIGRSLTGFGSAIGQELGGLVMQFAQTGDALEAMKIRTGFSIEALQQLKYAAGQNATDIGTLELAIRRMQRTIAFAALGMADMSKLLGQIGLRAQDIEGLSPERKFLKIAQAIGRIRDADRQKGAALLWFGKSGTNVLPVAQNMEANLKRFQELRGAMTAEASKLGDDLLDSFGNVGVATSGLANTIGEELAPALRGMAELIAQAVSELNGFLKENKTAIWAAVKLAGAVAGIGVAVGTVGAAVGALSVAFAGIGGLATFFTAMAAAAGAAGISAASLGAALGPILIALASIAAALALIGPYWKDIEEDVANSALAQEFRAAARWIGEIGTIFQRGADAGAWVETVTWAVTSIKNEFLDFFDLMEEKWEQFSLLMRASIDPGGTLKELIFDTDARRKKEEQRAEGKAQRDAESRKARAALMDRLSQNEMSRFLSERQKEAQSQQDFESQFRSAQTRAALRSSGLMPLLEAAGSAVDKFFQPVRTNAKGRVTEALLPGQGILEDALKPVSQWWAETSDRQKNGEARMRQMQADQEARAAKAQVERERAAELAKMKVDADLGKSEFEKEAAKLAIERKLALEGAKTTDEENFLSQKFGLAAQLLAQQFAGSMESVTRASGAFGGEGIAQQLDSTQESIEKNTKASATYLKNVDANMKIIADKAGLTFG